MPMIGGAQTGPTTAHSFVTGQQTSLAAQSVNVAPQMTPLLAAGIERQWRASGQQYSVELQGEGGVQLDATSVQRPVRASQVSPTVQAVASFTQEVVVGKTHLLLSGPQNSVSLQTGWPIFALVPVIGKEGFLLTPQIPKVAVLSLRTLTYPFSPKSDPQEFLIIQNSEPLSVVPHPTAVTA